MHRQVISTTQAPPAIGPYSQAMAAGGLVFVSGQIPLDPGTGELVAGGIAPQAERVLDNLAAVLTAAGAGWPDLVQVTVYLVSLADFAAFNEIYARRFAAAPPPARVTVEVAALPRGARIEISGIAAVESRAPVPAPARR